MIFDTAGQVFILTLQSNKKLSVYEDEIIFSVCFKIANAYFFADVEDLIQRLLALKKKLIKYGIDESIKNKSGWRV